MCVKTYINIGMGLKGIYILTKRVVISTFWKHFAIMFHPMKEMKKMKADQELQAFIFKTMAIPSSCKSAKSSRLES